MEILWSKPSWTRKMNSTIPLSQRSKTFNLIHNLNTAASPSNDQWPSNDVTFCCFYVRNDARRVRLQFFTSRFFEKRLFNHHKERRRTDGPDWIGSCRAIVHRQKQNGGPRIRGRFVCMVRPNTPPKRFQPWNGPPAWKVVTRLLGLNFLSELLAL